MAKTAKKIASDIEKSKKSFLKEVATVNKQLEKITAYVNKFNQFDEKGIQKMLDVVTKEDVFILDDAIQAFIGNLEGSQDDLMALKDSTDPN